MALLPLGTRIIRTGFPPDPWHGMKGTVVGWDLNERNRRGNNSPLRYNLVKFDNRANRVSWVEGHAGVVPLTAIELLGELALNPG